MALTKNLSSPRRAALALCLALLGAASLVYYHQGLFMPRVLAARAAGGLGNGYSFGNDFYQVWLTNRACLRDRRDPYSPQMTREIQMGLYGRPLDAHIATDPVDRRVFPYPYFAILLFWPAGEFAFPLVRVAVLCVLFAMTLVSVPVWLRAMAWRPGWQWVGVIILLTMSSYSVLEGLFAGQLGLLVGFMLAASILSLQRGREFFSGFLLALTTIKPQVTLLVVVYLLIWSFHDWAKRGRFAVGFFSTVTLLLGTSLVVRPSWIRSWIQTVLAYHQYTRPPLITEVLTSPLGPHASGVATFMIFSGLMVAAVALAWRRRACAADSMEFWLTLSLLLAITSITLLPGQAIYDHVILLPGIFFLARYGRELGHGNRVWRLLLAAGSIVLFWPWVAAVGMIVGRWFLPVAVLASDTIFALPIRTAASLPFAVVALLAYAVRARSTSRQARA
jgi:hypothetical protein